MNLYFYTGYNFGAFNGTDVDKIKEITEKWRFDNETFLLGDNFCLKYCSSKDIVALLAFRQMMVNKYQDNYLDGDMECFCGTGEEKKLTFIANGAIGICHGHYYMEDHDYISQHIPSNRGLSWYKRNLRYWWRTALWSNSKLELNDIQKTEINDFFEMNYQCTTLIMAHPRIKNYKFIKRQDNRYVIFLPPGHSKVCFDKNYVPNFIDVNEVLK